MTTREKIEGEIKKSKKNNRIVKIVGFVLISLCFAILFLMWQSSSYSVINNREVAYENNGKNQVQIITNDISEDMSQWVYSKYTYLESVDDTLSVFVLFGSSILVSAIFVFLLMVPMFGSLDRLYYDEFNLNFVVNGKKVIVNDEDTISIIKGIPIYDVEDLGDMYKFKSNLYYLVGVRSTKEFEVEKWKVTPKTKKWIWF